MSDSLTQTASPSVTLNVAPAQTVRGENILPEAAQRIAHLGQRPFLVAGDRTLNLAKDEIEPHLTQNQLTPSTHSYGRDCDEADLERLKTALHQHQADVVIGIGGGKALRQRQTPRLSLSNSRRHHSHLSRHLCRLDCPLQRLHPRGSLSLRCPPAPLPQPPRSRLLPDSHRPPDAPSSLGLATPSPNGTKPPSVAAVPTKPSSSPPYNRPASYGTYSCKNPPPPSPNPVAPSGGKWSMPAFS